MDDIQPGIESRNDLKDARFRSWFWCHNVILDMGLSVYEVAVYCALARHADGRSERRICFPSYSRLSRTLGCSRPRAVQAVQILIQKGLLKKTFRKDEFGHHSNLYELVDPMPLEKMDGSFKNKLESHLVNEAYQDDQDLAPQLTGLTTPVNRHNQPGQSGLPRTRTSEQQKKKETSSADRDPYAHLYVKGNQKEDERA